MVLPVGSVRLVPSTRRTRPMPPTGRVRTVTQVHGAAADTEGVAE